jgi:inner membrane transporter RhtA
MVFLRLVSSSLILLAFVRPRLRGRRASDGGRCWRWGSRSGDELGVLRGFSPHPLGVAVTIVFVGPLLLAALGSRRPSDRVWVGLAALGITLFGAGPTKVNAVGFGLALSPASCWALYIISTAATGRRWAGVKGWPWPAPSPRWRSHRSRWSRRASGLLEPRLLALGALVGLLSSVVPYSLEMVALRTLTPRVFSVLMSLEPAAVLPSPPPSCSASSSRPATAGDRVRNGASVGAARTESAPRPSHRD